MLSSLLCRRPFPLAKTLLVSLSGTGAALQWRSIITLHRPRHGVKRAPSLAHASVRPAETYRLPLSITVWKLSLLACHLRYELTPLVSVSPPQSRCTSSVTAPAQRCWIEQRHSTSPLLGHPNAKRVLVRAFHTSSVRRAPIWLPWASRLMGWFWHSVPEPLKRRLYRLLPRYRILFAVLFATGLWSISHMEVTPVTGRLRFVDVEPSEVNQVMNTARHQLAAQYADSELFHAEPVCRRVHAVTQRLRHVVQSLEQMGLVPHVDFNVFVVHGDELAFSLQTGEIMLFTNLFDIAKDDDALAYVIGHEMAHCLLSHTSEKMSKSAVYLMAEAIIHFAVASQLGFSFLDIVVHDPLSELLASLILNLPHSRTQEYEADLLGMYLATRACYEPEGGPRFFEGLRLYRYQQMRSDAKKEQEQQQQQPQQGQHLQQQGERQIQHTAHVGSDQPVVDDTASSIHRWIRGHIDSNKRYKDFDVITFPRLSEESYSSVNDSTSVAAPTESSSTAQAGRLGDGHADAEVRAVASSPPLSTAQH